MHVMTTLISICLLSSCISIAINSTNYKLLTEKEKSQFKAFEKRGPLKNFEQESPVNIYVVTTNNIETIIQEDELVWIHKWRPFCSAESCQIISPFEAKANKMNVALAFITETADIEYIQKAVKVGSFNKPIYFGDFNFYGNGINKARQKMKADLLKNQTVAPLKYADDFLYKNSKLIYQGDGLIDSLEVVLKRNQS